MRLDYAHVREQMEQLSSDELAEHLRDRASGEWQDEVYDVMQEVLRERGVDVAPLLAPPRAMAGVFIAASLDGYIARADGSLDWLGEANAHVPAGEDSGYGEFLASVDTIVLGRNTFDTVLGFDTWPYEGLRTIVWTRRPLTLPEGFAAAVEASDEEPIALLTRLASEGAESVYVDGGVTIQHFLAADAIDEITVTTVPVLLGGGRPLFGTLPRDMRLELLRSRAFPWGFVQSTYAVDRATLISEDAIGFPADEDEET